MLGRGFYGRDTATVARALLGKRIIRKTRGMTMSGIITETEAYGGSNDPASHAFRHMTERNKVMFGRVGISYVYFTYGMHYCFNVVAKSSRAQAGAVLIRAMHPQKGTSMMQKNRGKKDHIADGPAKLACALGITREQYGLDVTRDPSLHISDGIGKRKITASPRIGIKEATSRPWNFKITV